VHWFGLGRLVTVALSVLAVGLGAAWVLRTPAPPTEATLPYARRTSSAGATSTSASTFPAPTTIAVAVSTSSPGIVVDVEGAVARPGVLRLPAGARVVDAVAAAGGPRPDAQLDLVNLAAVLRDGDRLQVPSSAGTSVVAPGVAHGSSGPATTTQSGPIDLNRAQVDDLDRLPGVGPATAAAIVAYREAHGPFASVDDLAKVHGIGPAKLAALRDLVVV
jgi:competence protein ComEA